MAFLPRSIHIKTLEYAIVDIYIHNSEPPHDLDIRKPFANTMMTKSFHSRVKIVTKDNTADI